MPLRDTARGTIHFADYRHSTAAPPTFLIHGAGSRLQDWPSSLCQLPAANALALDLPGHGKSAGPGRRSIAAYALDVLALLDALNIPRAHIAGHSMGGAIALQMALSQPERVKTLILLGTSAHFTVNPAILEGILARPEETARMIIPWMWRENTPADMLEQRVQQLLSVSSQVTHDDFAACNAFDVRERLPEIAMPTLVIGGERDRMARFALSEELAAAIPAATLIKIAAGSHMFVLEEADALTAYIEKWLRKH